MNHVELVALPSVLFLPPGLQRPTPLQDRRHWVGAAAGRGGPHVPDHGEEGARGEAGTALRHG